MCRKSIRYKCCARVVKLTWLTSILLLILIGCSENAPDSQSNIEKYELTTVLVTDSDEWQVCVIRSNILAYTGDFSVPEPIHLPTLSEAHILKTLTYPYEQRFLAKEGTYTFAMPGKCIAAGRKTKYSVLGLYRRKTVIEIQF